MLKDKVVIVTGAGRGIGREMALEMGRLGRKADAHRLISRAERSIAAAKVALTGDRPAQ